MSKGLSDPSVSIYDHVAAHLDPSGRGLLDGGWPLPDEELHEGGIAFAPGVLDGIATHHIRSAEGGDEEIAALAQRIADEAAGVPLRSVGDGDFEDFENFVAERFAVRTLDAVLQAVLDLRPGRSGLRVLGERLAMHSRRREAVKLGIALIGIAGEDVHRGAVLTLGRHEEFTLYAAVALERTVPLDDVDTVLMRLCDAVEGWGKVNIIERLLRSDAAGVRAWLLRDAIAGDTLASMYATLSIAETADLAGALAPETIDDALFFGAAEILEGLFDLDGPAGDITDYADAPAAIDAWLRQAEARTPDLRAWSVIESIKDFAPGSGWSGAQSFIVRCVGLQDRSAWAPAVRAALQGSSRVHLGSAVAAARHHGVDPFDALWARLNADPRETWCWSLIIPDITGARLPLFLALARATVAESHVRPLGDTSDRPFRDWITAEMILDSALRVLGPFPGEGIDLVERALNAYASALRIGALDVLRSWGPRAIPTDTLTLLREARVRETDAYVQRAFDGL